MSPPVASAAQAHDAGLDPVGDGEVVEPAEPVDALDGDDPVGLHRDEGAHLLQDRDEVHDLGLDRGVAQRREARGRAPP